MITTVEHSADVETNGWKQEATIRILIRSGEQRYHVRDASRALDKAYAAMKATLTQYDNGTK